MSDENIYMVERNGQTAMLYRVPKTTPKLYQNSHQEGEKTLEEWLSQWKLKQD